MIGDCCCGGGGDGGGGMWNGWKGWSDNGLGVGRLEEGMGRVGAWLAPQSRARLTYQPGASRLLIGRIKETCRSTVTFNPEKTEGRYIYTYLSALKLHCLARITLLVVSLRPITYSLDRSPHDASE